ncbi:MAG: FAD-dependent oxidoreductase [Opitutales bacterium]
MQEAETEYEVLILGGGFAGVYCAKELAKAKGVTAALIARENHMVFQPLLAEVASASVSPRHVVNPLRHMCRGITVQKGEVKRIDHSAREVRLSAGDFTPDVVLRYRRLVLALGAVIDLSKVPGMTEHALLMQNVGDAMKLRATIISRFEEANLVHDREKRRSILRFVVVGGGYSGVETAGEVHDLMTEVHRYYTNVDWNDFEVILVHSRERILPTMSDKMAEYALSELQRRGIRTILGNRVSAVTAKSITLDDGSRVATSTVVSTIGNAPNPRVLELARDLGLETTGGRLDVSAAGRVLCTDDLWAAGDCAAWPKPGCREQICPATAQFAQRQGSLVGKNLLKVREGRIPERFEFTGFGEMAAIGNRTAVANIMGMNFSGFIAWWMWRTVYVMKMPGLERKLRVILDWTLDLFFPKDITLLNPQYTRLLRETYLQPGDILFQPGEPAFSVYFVKAGKIELFDGDYLVKEVSPGESFGERAILDDRVWHYRAVAREETYLVGLGAEQFSVIVQGSDELRRVFERSAMSTRSKEEVSEMWDRLGPKVTDAQVGDLMNRQVDSLNPAMTVGEALERMRQQRHGSYPVIDEDGKPRGALRRDDLFDYVKSHQGFEEIPLREIPLTHLPAIHQGKSGGELIELFLRSGRNKVLVVDDDGRLKGLVTMLDVVDAVPEIPAPAEEAIRS